MATVVTKNYTVIGLAGFLLIFSLACIGMTGYLINKAESFKENSTTKDQSNMIKAIFGMSISISVLLIIAVTFGQKAILKDGRCITDMTTMTKLIIFFSLCFVKTATIFSYGIFTTNQTVGDDKWSEDQVKDLKKNLITFLVLNIALALSMIGVLSFMIKGGAAATVANAA